jgi:hypothetical protein
VESRPNRVGGVKSEFRSTGLARQSALKDVGIDSMEFDVGLQTLACGWTGFECEDADALAFPVKKHCRQPNVCANVEDAIFVVQLNAVLQIAPRAEDFAVDKTRFIGI